MHDSSSVPSIVLAEDGLVPLGDQAILAYLPDEASAVLLAASLRSAAPAWLQDVVPAYASVGIFFDADLIAIGEVMQWVRDRVRSKTMGNLPHAGRPAQRFSIPVCYELQKDMARVSAVTGLAPEEIARLHMASEYTVYAIGFVPGFAYLGYLPQQLCGVDRLASPRLRVEPGSVGLTGRQTGIYPLPRPGGWNLIGQTPRIMVDVEAGFFPLQVGDRIGFERIDEQQFRLLQGTRLEADSLAAE